MFEDLIPQAPAGGGLTFDDLIPQKGKSSLAGDIGKSAGIGLAEGAIGVAAAPGDMRSLGASATGWLAGKLGAGPETQQTVRSVTDAVGRLNPLTMLAPTSSQIKEAVTPFTGEFYKPQTTAGEFAKTTASFLPGAAIAPGGMARNLIAGAGAGFGSETGGQIAKGTDAEPYARVAGALAGGMAPGLASRAITPLPAPPERQAAIAALQREGVPLTAGQRTGSKPLQYLESTLGDMPGAGGVAGNMQREQSRAFTAAALRRAGENADLATPEVMRNARDRIGGTMDDIAARANVQMDPQFGREIGDTVREYVSLTMRGQRPPLPDNIANALTDFAQAGGNMTGPQFQSMRSEIGRALASSSNPELTQFLRGIRRSLDNLVERTAAPGIAQEWGTARSQYGNYKTIEKAIGGAGENAAQGMLSPSALRNALAVGNRRGAYVRGQGGDLSELARAGETAMKPLPQSGTAPRAWAQALMAGGGAATGDPMMFASSILAPAAIGRALMSRPMQAYLGNQAVPNMQNAMPMFAAPDNARLVQLLLARPSLPQQ